MLFEKLHTGIGIAGLQEHRDLSALAGLGNQVLTEIGTRKYIINEILLHFRFAFKDGRGQIVKELARLPA